MSNLNTLKASRSAYKGRITRVGQRISHLCGASFDGNVNADEIRSLQIDLHNCFKKFEDLQMQILGECTNESEHQKLLIDLQEVEEKFMNFDKIATYFLDDVPPTVHEKSDLQNESFETHRSSLSSKHSSSSQSLASVQSSKTVTQPGFLSRFFGKTSSNTDHAQDDQHTGTIPKQIYHSKSVNQINDQKVPKIPAASNMEHLNKIHSSKQEYESRFHTSVFGLHKQPSTTGDSRLPPQAQPSATIHSRPPPQTQPSATIGNQPPHTQTQPLNSAISPEQLTQILQTIFSNMNVDRAPVTFMHQTQTLKFSGKQVDWPSFRDLFISIANRCQTDADRLLQLKLACQGGEAERIISYYATTNENFIQAWNALETEYSQGKHVVMSHIRTVLDQKPLTDESATQLRKVYTTTDNSMRALQAINYVDKDLWIITILLDKLDNNTSRAWALYSANMKLPTLNDLLQFLNQRCIALETCKPTARRPHIKSHVTKSSNDKKQNDKSCQFGQLHKARLAEQSNPVPCFKVVQKTRK